MSKRKFILSAEEFGKMLLKGEATTTDGLQISCPEENRYSNTRILKRYLNGVDVEGDVSLINKQFPFDIEISNCTFKSLRISNSPFHGLRFENCIFEDLVLETKVDAAIELRNCTVNKRFSLYSTTPICRLMSCTFNDEFEIMENGLIDSLSVLFCNFTGKEIIFRMNSKNIDFYKNTFQFLVRFEPLNTEVRAVILECDFAFLILSSIQEKSNLTITNTHFKQIELFSGFKNLGYMIFNSLKPKPDSTIKLINAMMGKLDIISCDFKDVRLIIESSKIIDLFYTNTKLPSVLSLENELSKNKHDILHDGYNQLKSIAQKQNDRKLYLRYQAEELRNFNFSLNWKDNFWTKLQLSAMEISNDYGVSWVRGVVFLLITNLIFLCLASSDRPFDLHSADRFMAEFMEFLFAFTTKPKFLNTNWETFWFYVSRAFVIFGIYQTISAFRKFGKGDS